MVLDISMSREEPDVTFSTDRQWVVRERSQRDVLRRRKGDEWEEFGTQFMRENGVVTLRWHERN